MTKREKQMKAMLNYFEIDMGSLRDEKMTKKALTKFLDDINLAYDKYTIQDTLKNIKDKLSKKFDENEEEKEDDFLNAAFDDMDSVNKNEASDASKFPFAFNPEIEKFMSWLYNVLYSADHKVTIKESDDGKTTHIELTKIQKKGGRKK